MALRPGSCRERTWSVSTFKIQCPSCGAVYSLPNLWKESLHNKQIMCVACKRPWVTDPETGPLRSPPEPLKVDLTAYRVRTPTAVAAPKPVSSQFSPPPAARQTTQQVTYSGEPIKPERGAFAPPAAAAPAPAASREDPLDGTVMDMSAEGAASLRRENPLADLDVGLVFVEGPHKGKGYRIDKTPCLVGRTGADVNIPDGKVSRKHAEIEILGPGEYSLKDLASTNGTLVNDRRVSTTRIDNGAIVSFGGIKLKFVARPKQRTGMGNIG